MIGWVLLGWLLFMALGLAFNYGAHRRPDPPMRVLYAVPDLSDQSATERTAMHATCPQCGEPDTLYPTRVDGALVCRSCSGWTP